LDVSPTWTPDGKRLLWASDRDGTLDLYYADPNGNGLVRLTTGAKVLSPTVSSDGKTVAAVSGGRLKTFSLEEGAAIPLQEITSPGARLRSVVWSRSGDRAAFVRALPSKERLRETGNGTASVAVGPFGSSARATKEAWSLEISGFYSDVRKRDDGWYAIVGRKLNPAEADALSEELGRARFAMEIVGKDK
jgi:hypothetical protein